MNGQIYQRIMTAAGGADLVQGHSTTNMVRHAVAPRAWRQQSWT